MFLFFDIDEERNDIFKFYNNIKLNLELIINYIENKFYIFNLNMLWKVSFVSHILIIILP